jgi:hypothetical protein
VLRVINLNAAISIGIKEQLQVIVDAYLEANWDLRDVNVTGIAVVIAVGNTESELTST